MVAFFSKNLIKSFVVNKLKKIFYKTEMKTDGFTSNCLEINVTYFLSLKYHMRVFYISLRDGL